MKIIFEIYYHTRWGESLFLSGDIDELGANEENRAVMMDYQGDGLWKYTMELPASAIVRGGNPSGLGESS